MEQTELFEANHVRKWKWGFWGRKKIEIRREDGSSVNFEIFTCG